MDCISAEEARKVAKCLSARGIECVTLKVSWDDRPSISTAQLQARDARSVGRTSSSFSKLGLIEALILLPAPRYTIMAAECRRRGIDHLLLGHYQGDQIETFLTRFMRASGIAGLSGMQPKSSLSLSLDPLASEGVTYPRRLTLLRPLLSASKEGLRRTCRRFDQAWIEDPSNTSETFDRVRARRGVATMEAAGIPAFAASAVVAHMQEGREQLLHATTRLLQQHAVFVEPHGHCVLSMRGLGKEMV